MLCPIEDGFEVLRTEIANTDAFKLALVFKLFQDFPQSLKLARWSNERVVNEEAIRDEAEPVQGTLNSVAYFINGNRNSSVLVPPVRDYV